MHPAPSRPPTPRELRAFAWTVGLALLALAALLRWRGRGVASAVLAGLAAALVLAGVAAPSRLAPVERAWMALARAISRVTNPLVLGVVWFAVLTPIGLVMRALGRRPLARRRDASTFWVDRPADARRSDLRRQF
jgi:hypothetical protein